MTNEQVHLILTGQYLLTMNPHEPLIAEAGLAIAGDTIVAVGKAVDLQARYPQAKLLAEPHGLIMPGLVNVHTHAAMSLFRGMADDLPLMQWLQDYIFPAEAKLNEELVELGTMLSLCEMIKSGTTSFCDMYLFTDAVARAAEQAGMRAWIGEGIFDFPSPNYGALENGFAYTQKMLARWGNHPLVTPTVCPHAVYTCSPYVLTRLADMAEEAAALYVIHLAENAEEVRLCQERYGQRPVQHLEHLGLLDQLGPHLLAAHCVMLDAAEIALMADQGVSVAHCPESNMKLASGIAPVPQMLAAGMTVGIGTDGSASNNDVDMLGEMRTAALLHKVAQHNPTVMDAASVVHAATLGGAKALGAVDKIGSLEVGKKADCIVLDLHQSHLTPIYHPMSHLVYAARGSDVIHSLINGRLVMRDRQLLTLDETAIMARATEIARRMQTL
jgi:5-methylthioadenosine/S-adenosylhomocysteine deaminase